MTVRILIGLITLILLSSSNGWSQKFSLGVKGGILIAYANFADQADKSKSNVLLKPGFSVSGLIDFPLKKKYSFQAEAGVSQQGRIISFNSDQQTNNSTYYFADLSMNLRRTFRLKIKKDIASNWFVNVGPNINYWMAGNGTIETSNGIPQDYTIVFDETGGAYDKMYVNDQNRWLFGLNLGFGFNAITKRNQKIITEIRLTWGQTYFGTSKSAYWNNITFQGQESLKYNLKVLNVSVAYIFDKDLRKAKMGKSTIKIKKKKHR